ncbi:MAG: hypothetical protein HY778_00215 [Betaproteobacteria bacterium]|nr:hypothetical protein [Betaproteobacteria bacterium]
MHRLRRAVALLLLPVLLLAQAVAAVHPLSHLSAAATGAAPAAAAPVDGDGRIAHAPCLDCIALGALDHPAPHPGAAPPHAAALRLRSSADLATPAGVAAIVPRSRDPPLA